MEGGNVWTGIAVGVGALIVWPLIAPVLRPAAKAAIKGGLIAYREAERLYNDATAGITAIASGFRLPHLLILARLYWHARNRDKAEIVFNRLHARQRPCRSFGRCCLLSVFDRAPEPDIAVPHSDIDKDRFKLLFL